MSYSDKLFWKQLDKIVSVIPKPYVDALLVLHEKLDGKNLKWIVDGDLSECMKVVQIEPNFIEIVTSKNDATQFFQAVQEFNPSPIFPQTLQLERNAIVDGKEYPVYIRSFGFNFILNNILVKVHGDLQFKVADWDWGEIYDFEPEYVNIVGKRIAVTPLEVKLQLYESLGWTERSEKIKQTLQKLKAQKNQKTQ
jgi:hypothetical protein